MEFAGGKRDVVDPEVRAYVASLVTAVSILFLGRGGSLLMPYSLEEVVPMKTDDTY